MNLTILAIWLACHFLGDFPLQGEYLAAMKGKSWEHLVYHCACYTGVFVLFAHPSIQALTVLFVTHIVIDAAKARYKVIPWIWLDQVLHIIVILAILATRL